MMPSTARPAAPGRAPDRAATASTRRRGSARRRRARRASSARSASGGGTSGGERARRRRAVEPEILGPQRARDDRAVGDRAAHLDRPAARRTRADVRVEIRAVERDLRRRATPAASPAACSSAVASADSRAPATTSGAATHTSGGYSGGGSGGRAASHARRSSTDATRRSRTTRRAGPALGTAIVSCRKYQSACRIVGQSVHCPSVKPEIRRRIEAERGAGRDRGAVGPRVAGRRTSAAIGGASQRTTIRGAPAVISPIDRGVGEALGAEDGQHVVDGIGRARDEQAAGGLRIGQQRALDVGSRARQRDGVRASGPVARRRAGDDARARRARARRDAAERARIRSSRRRSTRGRSRADGPARPKPVTSVSAWTAGIAPNAMPGVLSCVVLAIIAA